MGLADTSAARPGNGYRSATHPADPQPLPHNESAAHKPSQHPHSCRKTHHSDGAFLHRLRVKRTGNVVSAFRIAHPANIGRSEL